VLRLLNDTLVAGQWVASKPASRDSVRLVWKFNGQEGGSWSGTAQVEPAGSKIVKFSLKIERTDAISAGVARVSEPNADGIVVRDAWIQEMPASKPLTAAHMIIENLSGKETALIGPERALRALSNCTAPRWTTG
jgi:hypothetical protein